MISSSSVRGYFLQFSGLIGYIEQYCLPSSEYFINAQTLGNLQHAPQLVHAPLRSFDTGSRHVRVLFIFADHVLFLFFAITSLFQITLQERPIYKIIRFYERVIFCFAIPGCFWQGYLCLSFP